MAAQVSGLRWPLVLLLIVGFALRVYGLESQSLWYDEGISAALALRGPVDIARQAAADIHPPLYYYLLKSWTAVAGGTEFGLRSLSAFLGTLLLAATAALGVRLLPLPGTVAAVALSVVSPFQVHYAQETRMYMLTAALGALSVLAYLAASRGALPRLAALTVLSAATLSSHYFGLAVPLALGLHAVVRKRWPAALALFAAGGLFLPWLWFARHSLAAWPAQSEPPGLLFLLRDLPHVWLEGLHPRGWVGQWSILGALGLLLAVIGAWRARLLVTLYLVVPVGLMLLLSWQRPVYDPKFLLLATPAFYLALGGAIAWMSRQHQFPGLIVLGVLGFLQAEALMARYTDPARARDDYRGLAATIARKSRPGDAVLLNAPTQVEIFGYYYDGPLPTYPLPETRPPDRERTLARLHELEERHQRLWAIFWASEQADPEGIVEGWLDRRAYVAREEWFGSVRLALYALPAETATKRRVDARFGQVARLVGYRLAPAGPGEVLRLNLEWEVLGRTEERYKVFTHLLDAAGRVVTQRDSEPLAGTVLTTEWQPGSRLDDPYGLLLPADLPPGEYHIEVGFYSLEDGQRVPLSSGEDRYLLEPVPIGG